MFGRAAAAAAPGPIGDQLTAVLSHLQARWAEADTPAWEQLALSNAYDFQWKHGVTPMSHIAYPMAFTVAYLITIFALKAWYVAARGAAQRAARRACGAILATIPRGNNVRAARRSCAA